MEHAVNEAPEEASFLAGRAPLARLPALCLVAIVTLFVILASMGGDRGARAATNEVAQKRLALVIGNSNYRSAPKLPNPMNDSADMAAALERLGFRVIKGNDLDLRAMQAKLEEFARAARDSDVALVFYAGHGLQFMGDNFIVPIDADVRDDISLDYQTLQIDELLKALDRSAGVRILILDACRDLALGGRAGNSSSVKTGFSKFDARRNMLVAYSTVATEAAFDGNSRNSFFTGAILKEIEEPGIEIGQLFRRVAAEVSQATGGQQVPEVSRTLADEFYFNRGETDAEVWARLRVSSDPDDFRNFVKRFPKSFFVEDAKGRILQIENEREAAATIARIEEMRLQARSPDTPSAAAPAAPPAPAQPRTEVASAESPDVADTAQIQESEAELRRSFAPKPSPAPAASAEAAAIEAEEQALRAEHDGRQATPGRMASAAETGAMTVLTIPRSVEHVGTQPWSAIRPPRTDRERILLRAAQDELVRLGCLKGPSDGTMDQPTDIALRRFSEASGRFVKGDAINEDLVRALMNYGGRLCSTPCARDGKACS